MRILLVEDERKVASFIARTLRENAYAVDIADTGEKGLELGRDVSYDAILLDVRLPGMSGIEVCRELRQRGVEAPGDDADRSYAGGTKGGGAGRRRR